MLDLRIDLDDVPVGARATAIYRAVRAAIVDGRLPPGERLPASRDLARQVGVARGTVFTAYERLGAEGFLSSRAGSGTFVAQTVAGPPTAAARRSPPGVVRPRDVWRPEQPPPPAAERVLHDFRPGLPDPALFPLEVWRRVVSTALRRRRLEEVTYLGPGPVRLQAEIARLLGLSRAVVTTGEDVVVTAGAQQAFDLVARVLLEPGDVVAVEDPGYDVVARLLRTHGADVRGIPVDGEGLVVHALPDRARLVYVTPSHQLPTGVTMSADRRAALLCWAGDHDALIVEDDYDSEFRWVGRPLEPLQARDADGRVVYVGSFSKSLLPSLRVGYAVAPRSLQAALREAKRVTTWDGDSTTHEALALFLAEGHHAAHVRRAGRHYGVRRGRLLDGLTGLDDVLDVTAGAAGLHVCARFRDGSIDDGAVAARLGRRGVRVRALSTFGTTRSTGTGVVLGFGLVPTEDADVAVRALVGALRSALR